MIIHQRGLRHAGGDVPVCDSIPQITGAHSSKHVVSPRPLPYMDLVAQIQCVMEYNHQRQNSLTPTAMTGPAGQTSSRYTQRPVCDQGGAIAQHL